MEAAREPNDFPWHLYITRWVILPQGNRENMGPNSACGGVLLNKRFAISAAHCFEPKGQQVSIYPISFFIQRKFSVRRIDRLYQHAPVCRLQSPCSHICAFMDCRNSFGGLRSGCTIVAKIPQISGLKTVIRQFGFPGRD